MNLAIVIVSYNARADLERCLETLMAAPPRHEHEIVVVDNASTDGSAALVRSRWPALRLIERTMNGGFSAANNDGMRAARGDAILLLNSDTLVPAGAIDALAGRLAADPSAAIAGPRLIDADGRAELSFGPMIAPLAELRQKVLLSLYRRGVGPVVRYVEAATRRERYVDWVSGAALLVRRADAEAVGLLDERFFLYTEDVDFCAAVRARGGRVLFTPAAEIVHLRGRSRASAAGVAEAAYRRSHLAFYEKHHPRWAPLLKLYLKLKPPIRTD
ncbi:MAG: glycosyltransferase family 2 protein [Acidobacteria bacterium]|nr:glycosyltransferase family 2 protein [Acidobacteriota bacterium]MBA3886922.1 glycosyltransferase family 2 protein [Acidobacteriota bacterium]